MRVLLVVASYAPNFGGLQTVTRQLARELHLRGHDVAVITNRYPRTLPLHEMMDDVPVIRWHFLFPRLQYLRELRLGLLVAGFFYLPWTLARLVLLLRREHPDVVNLHFVGAPALFVLLVRWFVRFRLVVSLHGDDVEGLLGRSTLDGWIFCAVLRRAEVVTACSRYLLDQAIQLEGLAAINGCVIHNGIESLAVTETSREANSIVGAGRFVLKKGFDVLLQARVKAPSNPSLTLIGDGPEREMLERLARTPGLNNAVHFSGPRNRAEVLEQMAAAKLIVIPSRQEPFGLVALEAMALGKPVVATRVGGLPEVLKGADAFLVRPDDAKELAGAIEAVLERLRIEPQFGARNRELAARFSTGRMTDAYLEAYQA